MMRDLGAGIVSVLLNSVMPEIFDRPRGRCVYSSNKRDECWHRLDGAAEIYELEHFGVPYLRHGRDIHNLRSSRSAAR